MEANSLSIMLSKWWFRSLFFCIITVIVWSLIGISTRLDFVISGFPALIICSTILESIRSGSRWFALGLKFDKWMIKEILTGLFLVAASMIGVILLGIITGGNYYLVDKTPEFEWFLIISLVIFIYSSVEELFFRGILFQALLDKFSVAGTIFWISSIFAILHFTNRPFNGILLLNLFLANILLSSMYISTKSLWLPVSFHFFWNWGQAVFLGLNVTGNNYDIQFFQLNNLDSHIIFGGDFGIEAGIITTFLLLVMIPIVFKYTQVSPYLASVLFRRKYEESAY